jgi:tetratricopeptide (TPR) repeat protein
MSISELLAALRARIKAALEGDPSGVLDDRALADAAELYAQADAAGGMTVQVGQTLGWLHWLRYLALPDGQDGDDFKATLGWFEAVYDAYPRASMPDVVRSYLTAGLHRRAAQAPAAAEILKRVQHVDDPVELDKAVDLLTEAIAATPPGHPDLAVMLSNLGGALQTRFRRVGDTADLDEAVTVGRQAIAVTPPDQPNLAGYLSNLGLALQARFERVGKTGDLDEAVTVGREAVAATPPGHPNLAAYLDNLGSALRTRFRRTGETGDLDEAVTVGRQAIAATPHNHPGLATTLSNLGLALQTRFERVGDTGDLDEAVTVGRQAIAATPPDHPNLAGHLSNLGTALQTRFKHTSAVDDVREAVTVGREAVAATPPDHPDLAGHLSNLGTALQTQFEHTGAVDDVREAVGLWSRVAVSDTASAALRVKAAQVGAQAIAGLDGLAAALDLYRTAVELLPLLAWRGMSESDRRFLLDSEASFLARDAAAAAIAAGDHVLAVELLEQGRGVVWAQQLDTRTDLTDLENTRPDLAAQLHDCLTVLDRPARSTANEPGQNPARAGDARRDAARRFDALVARIRALTPTDTFPHPDRFLQPPQVDRLLPDQGEGTVVVVNISRWRCDALILDHTGVAHVALPDLTQVDVINTAIRYLEALRDYERSPLDPNGHPIDPMARPLMEIAIGSTLGWLWDHITAPILDRLGHTTTPDHHAAWPRVWWCPTGQATVLPLHAAGHHTARTGRTVYDRVVSSYTPTLRALHHTRTRPEPAEATGPRLLVVAIPNTPDQNPLPGATAEQQALARLFGTDRRTELVDHTATHANITAHLPRHQWLHASCHGDQDLADPTAGGLLPHDWQTTSLLRPADLTRTGQTGGQFAFLSACKTATGGVTHLDEAITIATALQYTGWRHVIGTLWSVWDDTAATVTTHLYPQLTHHGILEPTHTAHALHNTLRTLRTQYPKRPSIWAPFIHIGP